MNWIFWWIQSYLFATTNITGFFISCSLECIVSCHSIHYGQDISANTMSWCMDAHMYVPSMCDIAAQTYTQIHLCIYHVIILSGYEGYKSWGRMDKKGDRRVVFSFNTNWWVIVHDVRMLCMHECNLKLNTFLFTMCSYGHAYNINILTLYSRFHKK